MSGHRIERNAFRKAGHTIHTQRRQSGMVEQENNPGSELGADAHFTIDELRPVP